MTRRTDSEIRNAVLREFKWDTRVDDENVALNVHAGIVALTGTVESWAARIAAEDAAHRVGGVLDVVNDIDVCLLNNAWRADTAISQAVRSALEWDVSVPDADIRSTVSNGDLTLSGDVDFWSQREDAEKAVRNIQGVHKVINLIQVKAGTPAPNEIRESIANALERHSQHEAEHIQIDVEDGRVVLSGAVHSWIERQSAVRAARLTAGVKTVVDHLTVEPYVT